MYFAQRPIFEHSVSGVGNLPFTLIYNLCEIIKELSFVFARKPLSKNEGTRCPNYLLQNFADLCMQLYVQSVFILRIKKIEEESSCEIQVSNANENLIILTSTIV